MAEVLAAAYAETGDFKAAVQRQKQALKSSGNYSKDELRQAQDRLQLYEANKPFRTE